MYFLSSYLSFLIAGEKIPYSYQNDLSNGRTRSWNLFKLDQRLDPYYFIHKDSHIVIIPNYQVNNPGCKDTCNNYNMI